MSNVPFTPSRESSEFEFVSGNSKDDQTANKNSETSNDANTEASEGLFGWVKGSSGGLFSKVAEKTKSSVETVITTLDPQMKDYIHSGGKIRVVVASDNHEEVNAIKDAFHSIFGLATIYGVPSRPKNVAAQPVGYAAAKQSALERLDIIRDTHPEAKEDGTILTAIETFLIEVGDEEWIEQSCLVLDDKAKKYWQYTQPTNVPYNVIKQLQESTQETYPLSWSGFSNPIGPAMSNFLNVSTSKWHETLNGIPRGVLLSNASKSLVYTYKLALKAKVDKV